MDDLDLYELFAGVEVLEQIEENANAAPRHEHKAVDPFIGKLEFFFKSIQHEVVELYLPYIGVYISPKYRKKSIEIRDMLCVYKSS